MFPETVLRTEHNGRQERDQASVPITLAPASPEGVLPEHPLVTIQPSRGWIPLNLRDLWMARELLYFLTWRDLKVRYKQTVLGVAWAVIQPLFLMLLFSLFFGKLAGLPSDGVPYPVFAFVGLLPWTFFANAVANSGNSLVGSSYLISKVYFPRMIIPAAAVVGCLLDLVIAFTVLFPLLAWYGIGLTWVVLLVPGLLVLLVLLALGVGLWLSALNVRYRDVRHALPFLVQLWMFATPVIYPATLVPDRWRWLLALNPMSGIIEGFRSALLGREVDLQGLSLSAAMTLCILLSAAYAFRQMERTFADVI